jgi:hypothetical protein
MKTKQPETKFKDIVANRLAETAQSLVKKLNGSGGRKQRSETSKHPPPSKKKKVPTKKRKESIKRHIFP